MGSHKMDVRTFVVASLVIIANVVFWEMVANRNATDRLLTYEAPLKIQVRAKDHPECQGQEYLERSGFNVKQMAEDSTLKDWPKFLPNYKNPCWFNHTEELDGLLCFPYFYLLGVAKSGTTSLFNQIVKHPDIVAPDGKEGIFMMDFLNRISQYTNFLATARKNIYTEEDSNGHHRKVTLDANPLLFSSPYRTQQRNTTGKRSPTCTFPNFMYAINPNTRLVVILRNPTERIFSHYVQLIEPDVPNPTKIQPELYHKNVTRAIDLLKDCLRQTTLRECAFNVALYNDLVALNVMLLESLYYPYAVEWLSVYPKEKIFFIQYEEFTEHPVAILSPLFEFLQLAPIPRRVLEKSVYSMKHHSGKATYHSQMLPKTRELLDTLFAPYNHYLSVLLGDRKWLYT